jgi:hypothetical protein
MSDPKVANAASSQPTGRPVPPPDGRELRAQLAELEQRLGAGSVSPRQAERELDGVDRKLRGAGGADAAELSALRSRVGAQLDRARLVTEDRVTTASARAPSKLRSRLQGLSVAGLNQRGVDEAVSHRFASGDALMQELARKRPDDVRRDVARALGVDPRSSEADKTVTALENRAVIVFAQRVSDRAEATYVELEARFRSRHPREVQTIAALVSNETRSEAVYEALEAMEVEGDVLDAMKDAVERRDRQALETQVRKAMPALADAVKAEWSWLTSHGGELAEHDEATLQLRFPRAASRVRRELGLEAHRADSALAQALDRHTSEATARRERNENRRAALLKATDAAVMAAAPPVFVSTVLGYGPSSLEVTRAEQTLAKRFLAERSGLGTREGTREAHEALEEAELSRFLGAASVVRDMVKTDP